MELSKSLLIELQKRLKVGNRKGVHLNAIPKKSAYKLDISTLSAIDENLPNEFLNTLLSKNNFSFEISWKDIDIDLFNLDEKEHKKFISLGKSFEYLRNQVEVIKSEKGIETFGFGFPLLIRRDRIDKKLTVAPLIIWQLELIRSKKNDTWVIKKNEDSPIYINEVLINHLKSDSNVDLQQISSETLENGLISKNELFDICLNVLERTNIASKEKLKTNLENVFTNILPIGSEEKFKNLALNDANSLIQFSGLFSYFEIHKHNIIKDYDELLKLAGEEISQGILENNDFQPITSIPTDPTQQSALNSLRAIKDLVIQGPPGTGKSQTLTGILVNALENRKKTLVVCEKNTALEILQTSLQKIGLSQHVILIHDISSDRKKVVTSVRNRLDDLNVLRSQFVNSNFTYDTQLKKINELVSKINSKHSLLKDPLLANWNWTDVVGLYLKYLSTKSNKPISFSSQIKFEFNYDEFAYLTSLITEGERFFKLKEENYPSSFLPSDAFKSKSFYELEDRINEAFSIYEESIIKIVATKDALYNEYYIDRKNSIQNQVSKIKTALDKINNLNFNLENQINLLKQKFCDLEQKDFSVDFQKFSHKEDSLKRLYDKYNGDLEFRNEEKLLGFSYKITSLLSKVKKQKIADFHIFNSSIDELNKIVQNSLFFSPIQYKATMQSKLEGFQNFYSESEKIKKQLNLNIEDKFLGLDVNYLFKLENKSKLQEHIDLLKSRPNISENEKEILNDLSLFIVEHFAYQKQVYADLQAVINESPDFKDEYSFSTSDVKNSSQTNKILKRIDQVNSLIDSTIDFEFLNADIFENKDKFSHLKNFQDLSALLEKLNEKIESDRLINNISQSKNLNAFINLIQSFIDQKKSTIDIDPNAFRKEYDWHNFINSLTENNSFIVNALLDSSNWLTDFYVNYFNRLLRENATDNLPIDQHSIDDLFEAEHNIKTNQINFVNNIWFNEQYNKTETFDRNNAALKVKNLFNFKGSAGHRRYSLRSIVERDIDLFTSFFPVILTTPDVASNLFNQNNKYFDIVLFDEASQLRLEDNLPAMLKGKQIVIAGDEHQMPPSNYFSKILDGDVESEDEIIEDDSNIIKDKSSLDSLALSCLSLLEFGTEMNFSSKSLDFHYRSKHPDLIEFSNHAFYKQKLKALPQVLDYKAISYINVGGVFENRVNELEADMVLSILENNIKKDSKNKYPSVGIATFNITQRDLIKNKIVERQKQEKYKDFNNKILELEKEGLFVKNLENIQGDERDIIILSTTYGNNVDGSFAERFGPLNFEKGYKLLNVIVTRAKYKNFIVTSIPEERILNFKSYLVTQKSNNKKAVLYAYLAYSKAISDGNEDLRLAVLDALKTNYINEANIDSDVTPRLESPFEEEVYERLSKWMDKTFIKTQYKVGGFRIDMVIDFLTPGIPKIALECDGAKYHSSDEAYLYDLHRQRILEAQGFVFHRIWGTNWWRDPDSELEKLLSFIENVKSPKVGNIFDISLTEQLITTDELIIPTDNQQGLEILNLSIDEENEEEQVILDLTDDAPIEAPTKKISKILLGSEIKVKFLNDKTIQKFRVVNEEMKSTYISDDILPLSIQSPIGKAVLNKSEGETARIEGIDRFIEILQVV
ncbi:AAA domain-containing protein [Chryseobacterium scophthalmum]|uniref:AAA domain-containing protein n=1 Tax=Chryseobacterium scophthalmum TaxID=59733 RepID=UPI003CFC07B4